MRCALGSDIHLEIEGQRVLQLSEPVDVLILAGDIGKGVQAIQYAHETFSSMAKNIVIVFGNHEFWKGTYQTVLKDARKYAEQFDNLHFLENETVEIDGVHFIGATAWADFKYGDDSQALHMWYADQNMGDYKKIKWKTPAGVFRKMQSKDSLLLNAVSHQYIFAQLNKLGGENCVVVTHHAPTHLSINEEFERDRLNCCYVSNWGNEIAYVGPKLWCHGHMHTPSDYVVGDTRVLCNPIGYPGQYDWTQLKIFDL